MNLNCVICGRYVYLGSVVTIGCDGCLRLAVWAGSDPRTWKKKFRDQLEGTYANQ